MLIRKYSRWRQHFHWWRNPPLQFLLCVCYSFFLRCLDSLCIQSYEYSWVKSYNSPIGHPFAHTLGTRIDLPRLTNLSYSLWKIWYDYEIMKVNRKLWISCHMVHSGHENYLSPFHLKLFSSTLISPLEDILGDREMEIPIHILIFVNSVHRQMD